MNLENYFSFYEISPSLEIDVKELRQKFLNISRQYHPDFFANDPAKQEEALSISSFNNEAFNTLKDIEKRIGYFLKISGKDIEAPLPPDFLMEMMDFNEALSDAKMEADSEKISAIKNQIEKMKADCLQVILSNTDLQEIAEQFRKLKYFQNLLGGKH